MGAHSGLTFSLSHSTRYCAIAIAGGPQIGVDIEERRDFIPSDGVPCLGLGNVLSDAERRAVAELPRTRRVSALLQFWTLKEAAVSLGLLTPDEFDAWVKPEDMISGM
jgi:phosphopantetheinyl transferase